MSTDVGVQVSSLAPKNSPSVRMGCFFYKKRRLELPRALGKVPAEKRHAAYLIVPYRKLLHLIDLEKRLQPSEAKGENEVGLTS